MQQTWPSAADLAISAAGRRKRVSGQRAVIEFTPKLSSAERLCAGVVVRLDDGEIQYRCALDAGKAEHAFGAAGAALVAAARKLCTSLAEHWVSPQRDTPWTPPFEGARIAHAGPFTAQSADSALQLTLNQHSTLHTLLTAYELPAKKPRGIVQRVRRALQENLRDAHFAPRFERSLTLGHDALPLRVDFLGQNFACYFVEASARDRGADSSTERAFSKLYELQALRRLVLNSRRHKKLGLLEDERPERFELLVVGSREHPVQRRAIAKIEALAAAERGTHVAAQ